MSSIPPLRLRAANSAPIRGGGSYVVYWMIAARRLGWNFALDHAMARCRELGKPLLILEALRCGYRWASDRHHRFVLEGMAEHRARLAGGPVAFYPYVEPAPGAGSGLLEALARDAALVVTDEFPCFFLPRMVEAAAKRLPVALEVVDGNGLLPMRAAPAAFGRAYDFRRFLQRNLVAHLAEQPAAEPLAGLELPGPVAIPGEILARWPAAGPELLAAEPAALAALPIDHGVEPGSLRGGSAAGRAALERFVRSGLEGYEEDRNHPDRPGTSGLSPYLHFGQLSAHEIFAAVAGREGWSPGRLGLARDGSREGFWGLSPGAEGFLDQLVTWRELGFNLSSKSESYDRYESLPAWARASLARHAGDPRPAIYSLEELARGETEEPLWNAAQRQLRTEGVLHGYLRMLWGKLMLAWSRSPEEALERMIELNNRYALDGRDPNSYSGIFWCLGRYDRPWGPERPIFGVVRFMTAASARRKLELSGYLRHYGEQGTLR